MCDHFFTFSQQFEQQFEQQLEQQVEQQFKQQSKPQWVWLQNRNFELSRVSSIHSCRELYHTSDVFACFEAQVAVRVAVRIVVRAVAVSVARNVAK